MTITRREWLGGMGIASASSLLWALGCGAPVRAVRTADVDYGDVRVWLRAAVDLLQPHFSSVQALAVSRRRTTAAIDVLGAGVARGRSDGVTIAAYTREGLGFERVSSELSARGVLAAAEGVLADAGRAATGPGPRPPPAMVAHTFGQVGAAPGPGNTDAALLARVDAMLVRDKAINSRIVYAAGMIDLDDAIVWSAGTSHELAQRLVRVRRSATRVAWNGTRPVISEVANGWTGGLDDHELDEAALEAATRAALELMTPGNFDDGMRAVILEPSVVAAIIDAVARTLLTNAARLRPEVAARLAQGAGIAAEALTLADDPTTPGAYGAFAFDDDGTLAAPRTLFARGHLTDVLSCLGPAPGAHGGSSRRPGHLGPLAPSPSHLRLTSSATAGAPIPRDALLDGNALILEGGGVAMVDPGSARVVVPCARAREVSGGRTTGHVYAEVELVGDIAALLGGVTAVSTDAQTFALRDEHERLPLWRSIEAPWLRGSGLVRARRRASAP